MVFNIYTVIIAIISAITVIITLILLIKSGKSFSISKNGVTIVTKEGHYILKEIADREKSELIEVTKRMQQIIDIEIINEQMTYVERELDIYYKQNLDMIKDETGINPKDSLFNMYQLVYLLHKEKMAKRIKEILKENHLADRPDWQTYKERQFRYIWGKALEYLDNYFGIMHIDRRASITEQMRDRLEKDFKMRFNEWMDEFREISIEKIKQVRELKERSAILLNGQIGGE